MQSFPWRLRGLLTAYLLVLGAGCATNGTLDLRNDATPSAKAVFDVFADSGRFSVDHVRISHDTLSGARLTPSSQSSIDVHIPVASVDSVRRIGGNGPGLTLAVLPFALAIGLMLIFRAGYGSD